MKNFFFEILFPKFCLGCHCQGTYLCQDCLALIDISSSSFKQAELLEEIFFACDYENFIVKKLIQKFKYKPFAKGLAKILTSLIIIYFQNLENKPKFFTGSKDFLLIPIPLSLKRLKWRGFNQAEEIAKELSLFLNIPILNAFIKTKETALQVNLPKEKRKENIKDAFSLRNSGAVKNKNIILVDDVFTTGATMIESAKILKNASAKKIYGIVVAKG